MNNDENSISPDVTPAQVKPVDIKQSDQIIEPDQKKIPPVKKASRRAVKFVILGIIIFVIAGIGAGMTALVYSKSPTDPLVRKIVNVIPYPAVKINSETLTFKDYLTEHDALVSFFDSLEDQGAADRPSEEELEINIIDTMINKSVIDQLAKEHGVELDQSEVDFLMVDVISSAGSEEDFETEIGNTFGWTKDEFRKQVIEPIVLAQQMSEFVNSSTEFQTEKREQADVSHARLENGEDFSLVASETNDDRSAIFGGDIGFLVLSELPIEWQEPVGELEVDEFTNVIETSDGFAILHLTDRVVDEEEVKVQLSGILVRKLTAEEVIETFLENSEVKRYIGKIE